LVKFEIVLQEAQNDRSIIMILQSFIVTFLFKILSYILLHIKLSMLLKCLLLNFAQKQIWCVYWNIDILLRKPFLIFLSKNFWFY